MCLWKINLMPMRMKKSLKFIICIKNQTLKNVYNYKKKIYLNELFEKGIS